MLLYISLDVLLNSFVLWSFDYNQDVREAKGTMLERQKEQTWGISFNETAWSFDAQYDVILILSFAPAEIHQE